MPEPRLIRYLDAYEPRVETGPVQHGDDWPGVFVRGDNAIAYVPELRAAAAALRKGDFMQQIAAVNLAELATLFESCNLHAPPADAA